MNTISSTVSSTIQTTEVITMEANTNALVSKMATDLYQTELLSVQHSLVVAAAWVANHKHMVEYDHFMDMFEEGLNEALVKADVTGFEQTPVNGDDVIEALLAAQYLGDEGFTSRFQDMLDQDRQGYAPIPVTEFNTTAEGKAMVMDRRFKYARVINSDLFKEAIHALEATQFTVSDFMLSIAKQVQAKLGNDKEAYVLSGCDDMDSLIAYISEFKGDDRLRMYQACAKGANGQASDRSRALMDLFGVPMDYDAKLVMDELRTEMGDMASGTKQEKQAFVKHARKNPVEFIIHHTKNKTGVSKPYSFVKCVHIMTELMKGNRPYIGIAVGLDAKCSGPQLGALACGDQDVAAACGFTNLDPKLVDDAYVLCCKLLDKAGFAGLTRSMIKKPFMGIFYGEGFNAYMVHEFIQGGKVVNKGSISVELFNIIHPTGYADQDRAKKFHATVSASFGKEMQHVRQSFRALKDKVGGKLAHFMPDGSQVAMDYRVKTNVLEEGMVTFDTEAYDVSVEVNTFGVKLNKFALKTKIPHTADYVRNGFVNMIQATDALLARLIIAHASRMGVQHIICVHDCFRVNVTEMHILRAAIKQAYLDLFGSMKNETTADLPLGQDILALYYEGAQAAKLPEAEDIYPQTQFTEAGKRRLKFINGRKVADIIKDDTSWFFAK